MGGCFSGSTKTQEAKAAARTTSRLYPTGMSLPPLPEADVEETVKEVLSETPRLPRQTPLPIRADQVATPKEVEIDDEAVPLANHSSNGCDTRCEDASEVRSISAKSETLSGPTTPAEKRRGAATETGRRAARDDRSPLKYQKKRSVSGEFACRRDRSVAVGCGSGRSSPSPAGRRSEHAAIGRTNSAREASARATRDPGERSNRRSVSPAAERAAELRQRGGQCRAPAAATARVTGSMKQISADEGERRFCGQREGTVDGGLVVSEGEQPESLENPLVSLECFIFL
ncbi:hypothetical protein MUK42_29651 [Musa troglodytarum]|uniref:Uncharacterized protein n=1 Tax=Musa troglodytarum TaxID=320322 RepID=A0A9E7FKW7_9LILI|nr:hypothetical protein MUK42_29651 [Musa troglodytarum]